MLITKRKPVSVGEILTAEFLEPLGLTQGALAEAMGVQRKHVNELCKDRRRVTAATALILARVFGTTPDFWLNVQRRTDLWEAMHDDKERARIEITGEGLAMLLLLSWYSVGAVPQSFVCHSSWPDLRSRQMTCRSC